MASINYAAREISVKIVYYGPGLSGKTTNLQIIHKKVPKEFKSDMVSLATETDRTLFFDFLPLDLGKIKGFSAKFQLYTVPGQVYYNATRKLVLRGVDGLVFVADSSPQKIQENLDSFQNMEDNLAEYGYKKENVSIILQYNKRDLPNAMSVDEMNRAINKYNLPWTEAVANKGVGVFESLKLIGKIVIDTLNQKYSRQSSKSSSGSSLPPSSPPPIQSMPLPPQQVPPVQQRQAFITPPPPPPPPPIVKEQRRPDIQQEPFNPFVENYGNTAAFSRTPPPPPPPPPPKSNSADRIGQPNNAFANFNVIPAEQANNTSWQPQFQRPELSRPSQPPAIGSAQAPGQKSGLDLEIERYEREIQQPQAPSPYDVFGGQKPPAFPPAAPQQQNYFTPQQPSATPPAGANFFTQQSQPMPMYQQQPFPPAFGNDAVFEVGGQKPQAQQPVQQDFGTQYSYPAPLQQQMGGATAGQQQYESPANNPMYFTSVNTDKSKKKKLPVNPKNKPKGGLFAKLFNRDEE
jgi:signal recognition particle receptor subunit beta